MIEGPPAAQARRLRAPLLVVLWALLAIEAVGGLVIFFARLASGAAPGLSLHWWAGWALVPAYLAYLTGHLRRVWPVRARLDYGLGVLAAASVGLTLGSGIADGMGWWRAGMPPGYTKFDTALSGLHNVASMLTLTFVGAHLAAVLLRVGAKR